MRRFPLLLLLFVTVPLLEIWLFVRVGNRIGAGWTVFFVIFTAVIGVFLVRLQGFATLRRMQRMMLAGEVPALEMLEGVALLVAGALLLTPGFFTDAVGFALLVPGFRRGLIRWVLPSPLQPPHVPGHDHGDGGPRTIEGEFRREDDRED